MKKNRVGTIKLALQENVKFLAACAFWFVRPYLSPRISLLSFAFSTKP